MEVFYLSIVILLGILAISDLAVGVSNDAVNFLNSAIGSKVAPLRTILVIASLGVLVGATFSSGLMEVARKGIFHPDQFLFSEIMIIFLAVMVTDIILLDLFNTFGLPTSTTVSIVFELLGAAVAVTVIKVSNIEGETLLDMGKYINSGKALAIISGILISVFIAFITGSVIMYISRLIFSFNYHRVMRYFGAVWGGLAISAITYFILIKGAKGASFISDQTVEYIQSNTLLILLYSFVSWALLLQLLNWLINVNVLKVIVLIGTFALAMAFASNDLVNFVGVPLAGLSSYQEFLKEGTDNFLMGALSEPVKANTWLLLLSGLVMVITLWTSKKARSVTATEVNLGRQHEGSERFTSTALSRGIVRMALAFSRTTGNFMPAKLRQNIETRFMVSEELRKKKKEHDAPAFDLIRASVNLVVASILIAFGTSLKLPLSTTYVTFMVAMGSSLSDRAWGRESAVYRVTGVFTVIGGWFLTALTAFLLAASFAFLISFTNTTGVIIVIAIAIFFLVRTQLLFRKKEKAKQIQERKIHTGAVITGDDVIRQCSLTVTSSLKNIPLYLQMISDGLFNEDLRKLKSADKKIEMLNQDVKMLKNNIHLTIEKLHEDSVETGHYYVQVLDYLREIAHCLSYIATPALSHVQNHHKKLIEEQRAEFNEITSKVRQLYDNILKTILEDDFENIDPIIAEQNHLLEAIEKDKKKQIKRIKSSEVGTKNSLLYLNMLEEIKNLILYTINLLKSQRDFVNRNNKVF